MLMFIPLFKKWLNLHAEGNTKKIESAAINIDSSERSFHVFNRYFVTSLFSCTTILNSGQFQAIN